MKLLTNQNTHACGAGRVNKDTHSLVCSSTDRKKCYVILSYHYINKYKHRKWKGKHFMWEYMKVVFLLVHFFYV